MTSNELETALSDFLTSVNELKKEQKHHLIMLSTDLALGMIDPSDEAELIAAGLFASIGTEAAMNVSDFKRALNYAEKEVKFGEQIQQISQYSYTLAKGLCNRGLIKQELGEFSSAERDYLSALTILDRSSSSEEVALRPLALNRLGTLYFERGETEKALEKLTESSLSQAFSSRNISEGDFDAMALHNQGISASKNGQLKEAENFYRRALSVAASNQVDPYIRGIIASNLGDVLYSQNQLDLAMKYFELACNIHRDHPRSRIPLAIDLHHLGLTHLGIGNREKAVQYFKEAWDIIRLVAPHSPVSIRILSALGAGRFAEGDFKRARAALEKGMELYEGMRPKIAHTEEGQEEIFKTYRQLVEVMMHLSFKELWTDEVMLLTERAKARFWLEQIDYLIDRKVLVTEENKIVEINKPTFKESQTPPPYVLLNMETVNEPADKFDYLMQHSNDLMSIGEKTIEASIGGHALISSSLKGGEAIRNDVLILNYFVGPDTTFLSYAFNKDRMSHRINISSPELFDLAQSFMIDLMGSSRRAQYSDNGKMLSKWLLSSIKLEDLNIRHIVIMPDGPLWYVPFDALPLPEKMNSGSRLLYLSDMAPVSYAPSITILDKLRQREKDLRDRKDWSFLVVADPEMSPTFSRLEGTLNESSELSRLMGDKSISVLRGNNATKENFLSLITNVTHIHIGSHALADLEKASPCIVFTGTPEKDDYLYAHEIANQRINADLVFLSACSTSLGKNSTGEGLMSIARAFLLSGCRCTIATLWPINDDEAPLLINRFYRYLSSGASVTTALRAARLECRKQGGNVRTWAAFQAYGHGDSFSDSLLFRSRRIQFAYG